jgi:hypothetical protein
MKNIPVGAGVADRELVDENPLLERLDVVDNSHSRSRLVEIVRDIVHHRAPVDHIARSLMGQLLSVQRISLVRVVSNELTVVLPARKKLSALMSSILSDKARRSKNSQKIRFPNWRRPISSIRPSTLGDPTDELPSPRPVRAGVQVNASAVVAPAIPAPQNRARGPPTLSLLQLRQSRLRTETPAIDLIGQVGDVLPVGAAVLRFEDGEVIWFVAGEGGGGDDGTVAELGVAWVGDAFIPGGLVDGVVGEVAPGAGFVAPFGRV